MRYTRDHVQTHYEHHARTALPAVNVKCYLYGAFTPAVLTAAAESAGHDPGPFVDWWAALETDEPDRFEQMISAYFDFAAETAFEDAQSDADYIFPNATPKVYAQGRSGGWLVVEGLPDLDTWAAPDLGRWRRFERCVQAIRDDFPARMAELVAINAYEAHLSDLAAAARYQSHGRWVAAFASAPFADLTTPTLDTDHEP